MNVLETIMSALFAAVMLLIVLALAPVRKPERGPGETALEWVTARYAKIALLVSVAVPLALAEIIGEAVRNAPAALWRHYRTLDAGTGALGNHQARGDGNLSGSALRYADRRRSRD